MADRKKIFKVGDYKKGGRREGDIEGGDRGREGNRERI